MRIPRMFPTAISLTTAGLATFYLPFAHGLRSAHVHTSTRASPTALEGNLHQHPGPLPRAPSAPKNPSLSEPTEVGQCQPDAHTRFATIP